MKLAVFGAKAYDRQSLSAANKERQASNPAIELNFLDFPLSLDTVSLAKGAEAVCVFVNDALSKEVLDKLAEEGVRAVLLRCAGFNNVDLDHAKQLGMFVANVPSYSPEAVAEFAMTLLQTLNRKTHRAYNRVREGNFNLDGLLGQTLHGKTVGIIGTGRIGLAFARIMAGMGCRLLAFDKFHNDEFKKLGEYTELDTLLAQSDFISLHCPLMEATKHIINESTLSKMKKGAILVNTSRGGLVNTKAVIASLKHGQLGGLALDVYEQESALFYNDHSQEIIKDDEFMRLMTFPNVIVTGHQAFFTQEALSEIANTTLSNLEDWLSERECKNALVATGSAHARRDSHPVRI